MAWKLFISKRELLERLERLERRFLELIDEWDDAFDRIRRAENRIKERRAKLPEPEGAASNGEASAGAEVGGFLTPRQRTIQQQILRRRAGGL